MDFLLFLLEMFASSRFLMVFLVSIMYVRMLVFVCKLLLVMLLLLHLVMFVMSFLDMLRYSVTLNLHSSLRFVYESAILHL